MSSPSLAPSTEDQLVLYGITQLFGDVLLLLVIMAGITVGMFVFRKPPNPYVKLEKAASVNKAAVTAWKDGNRQDDSKALALKVKGAVDVILSFEAQFTLVWESPVGELPAGECNLYCFPQIITAEGKAITPKGPALEELKELVRGLGSASPAAGTTLDAMTVPDASGARLVHGLLIANQRHAVECALDLLEMRPALVPIAHAEGDFKDENCLHVLAVNRRQSDMLRLLKLADDKLDAAGLDKLLNTPAVGEFFSDAPMSLYGGTAFAYACAFRCHRVLTYIFATPRLAECINLQAHPCPFSGYYPIHVAVANGRQRVFDLLVANGADVRLRTKKVTEASQELTALQLACKLGSHVMTEHILKDRMQVQWRWGPVVSYKLPLEEIDTNSLEDAFAGCDLMELMLAPEALPASQQMLLDKFMSGFLWELFQQKWRRFGRRLHIIFRFVDLLSLVLLVYLGLSLKEAPLTADRRVVPAVGVVVCAANLLYNVTKAALWYRDKGTMIGTRGRRIAMHAISVLACASILVNSHPPSEDGMGDELAWALLAIAAFTEGMNAISNLFIPYQQMGIFARVVERLLANDVQVFLTFFFLYLTCFWTAMYLTYPRAGTGEVKLVQEFNSMRDSFEAMVNLGIAGIHFDIDFSRSAEVQEWQTDVSHALRFLNLIIFSGFYYYCMLLLVILLLRMLMAMLTATFAAVRTQSELEWRLQFGRHVLELQLIAETFGVMTHSGMRFADGPDSDWFHVFRAYTEDDDDDSDPDADEATEMGRDSQADKRHSETPQLVTMNSQTHKRGPVGERNTALHIGSLIRSSTARLEA